MASVPEACPVQLSLLQIGIRIWLKRNIYIHRGKEDGVLGLFGEIDGLISSLMSPLGQSLQFSTFQLVCKKVIIIPSISQRGGRELT